MEQNPVEERDRTDHAAPLNYRKQAHTEKTGTKTTHRRRTSWFPILHVGNLDPKGRHRGIAVAVADLCSWGGHVVGNAVGSDSAGRLLEIQFKQELLQGTVRRRRGVGIRSHPRGCVFVTVSHSSAGGNKEARCVLMTRVCCPAVPLGFRGNIYGMLHACTRFCSKREDASLPADVLEQKYNSFRGFRRSVN